MKIVYILGLSRSGSTMLDLILGNNSNFIGLGEAFQVLRPDMNRFNQNELCSCGKVTGRCAFWGEASARLKREMPATFEERYKIIIDVFIKLYGMDRILVDSSKLLDPLQLIRRIENIDLKVIYLIRDVRAWTTSRISNRKKSPDYFSLNGNYLKRLRYKYGRKTDIFKWIVPFITRLPVFYFWIWYLQNKQIINYLQNNRIDYFKMGYDELALQPELMMAKIFDFLGQKYEELFFSSEDSRSHILVGNIEKSNSKRRQGIFYDNRWMYRNEWLISSALFPHIMRFNAKEVYKNIRKDSLWS